ncbi:MAG: tetratricopeptide repeat protein, partial [Nitrospirota bacterium]|nr:tetratricopeptide repeat protein [Nitrospirota bacterium]
FIITGTCFVVLTVQRNHAWKDDYSLWSDTVKKSPDSDVAHNNLGDAYEQKGRLDDALREYESAISLNPMYMDAYENRFRAMKLIALRAERR